jgi:hypothetical protein
MGRTIRPSESTGRTIPVDFIFFTSFPFGYFSYNSKNNKKRQLINFELFVKNVKNDIIRKSIHILTQSAQKIMYFFS